MASVQMPSSSPEKLPHIGSSLSDPGEAPTLRYLKYLRTTSIRDTRVKSCLPPLTIRTAQGKYGDPEPRPRRSRDEKRPTAPSRDSCQSFNRSSRTQQPVSKRAQSVPHQNCGRTDDAELRRKSLFRSKTEYLSNDMFRFPRSFCDGPLFNIYRSNPKLHTSMDLRRVKALKMVIGDKDFETKTGFSESNYEEEGDGLTDLAEKAVWARKRRDGFRPTVVSKHTSPSAHQRKSVPGNKLPTITDE